MTTTMRALSVRQPWADRIARGAKTVELRTWAPADGYRGPLLIVAGRAPAQGRAAEAQGLPRGVAVCVVDLLDVRPATPRDAHAAGCRVAPGELAWLLDNPRPVPGGAFPVRGELHLFTVTLPGPAAE